MKMLILISLIAAAAAKACGKGAAEAGSVAKVGAKNAGKFAGASAKYNKVAMTKEDILRQGLEKASMRNTKYLMNDLNTNDSRIYFKDSIVVMDNTRE